MAESRNLRIGVFRLGVYGGKRLLHFVADSVDGLATTSGCGLPFARLREIEPGDTTPRCEICEEFAKNLVDFYRKREAALAKAKGPADA